MKHFLLFLFCLLACVRVVAAQQDAPLSKAEVLDLLSNSIASRIIVNTVKQVGISFQPTPEILDQFRRAGADKALLAALREAWHGDIPKPVGDREILIMLAEGVASENIVGKINERGIDFEPSPQFLQSLPSQGANDALVAALRSEVPRPFSKDELVQRLRAHEDQEGITQKVQQRAIDFEPSAANLQALRNAGAPPSLLEAVRTARRVQPFAAHVPAGPVLSPPPIEGKEITLRCDPSDVDVPVLADPANLGTIVARLHCGERVTFVGKAPGRPGMDQIKFAGGKEGFVADAYLQTEIATTGAGITEPAKISCPDPPYTREARRDKIEGTVSLWIVIDAQGNVTDVQEMSQTLGGGLDKSAMDTVRTWKFQPAARSGVAVAVKVRVEVSFRLSKNRA